MISTLLTLISLSRPLSLNLLRRRARHVVTEFSFLLVLTLQSSPCLATDTASWELMNGNVQLSNPLVINVANGKSMLLRNPSPIGTGGGGAVFAFDDADVLIKVSWSSSTKSVRRECSTLQRLESYKVQGTEKCLGEFRYEADPDHRTMIAVTPYVRDAVANIQQVDKAKQSTSVQQVVKTMVQMLAANTITIDVQPLISRETGNVIFIDMTEAQTLHPPYTFLDKTLVGSFVTEMFATIPDSLLPIAKQSLVEELHRLDAQGDKLPEEVMEILAAQDLVGP